MATETTAAQTPAARWAIDLDWFAQHNRSAQFLIKNYLCEDCARRLAGKNREPSIKSVLAAIQSCCSKAPDFIRDRLPIMESVFRVFLSNGNRPMTAQELSADLAQRRSGDIYRIPPEALNRLLEKDVYYGLKATPD